MQDLFAKKIEHVFKNLQMMIVHFSMGRPIWAIVIFATSTPSPLID